LEREAKAAAKRVRSARRQGRMERLGIDPSDIPLSIRLGVIAVVVLLAPVVVGLALYLRSLAPEYTWVAAAVIATVGFFRPFSSFLLGVVY
jgi:membrane protein YdbS with pleckstrin-like domain